MKTRQHSKEPFLFSLAVPRTGESSFPGRYDAESHVWVLDGCEGPAPLILGEKEAAELVTKTLAFPERDDVGSNTLLELSTKTETRPERDDPGGASVLELSTKTSHQLERDDQRATWPHSLSRLFEDLPKPT